MTMNHEDASEKKKGWSRRKFIDRLFKIGAASFAVAMGGKGAKESVMKMISNAEA